MLSSQSAAAYRRAGLALLVLFVAVAVAECVLGAPPMAGPWDAAVLLDGAWRIICGQIPHVAV
ncbi:MAG TPA: hypothetical protein VE291_10840, partial [Terracidiphilus sp.]|nr:hypothetical protein [Terracidiphilus sp.]